MAQEPASLKEALQIGLARLKKDIDILTKIPSRDYPVPALQTTVEMLELLMRKVQDEVPHRARPSSVGLYFGTTEVELGKVQHGNGRDAKTKKDDGKS
jgi:hypothetical protein